MTCLNRDPMPEPHNPYAAPQAELATTPASAAGSGPRLQASYLRNALRNTFYVNLVLLVVLIFAATLVGFIEQEWRATLEALWAGFLVCSAFCWPIGIAVGCLGTFGDYLLQLFGRRTYRPSGDAIHPVMAELADKTERANSYDKN